MEIVILTASQAAIASVQNGGRLGAVRTKDLKWVLKEIGRRQERLGSNAVTLCWVKAYIGIYGNEMADWEAKKGAADNPAVTWITEGGLRQSWNERRYNERKVKGTGMGRVTRWNRKAMVNYTQCRTN